MILTNAYLLILRYLSDLENEYHPDKFVSLYSPVEELELKEDLFDEFEISEC